MCIPMLQKGVDKALIANHAFDNAEYIWESGRAWCHVLLCEREWKLEDPLTILLFIPHLRVYHLENYVIHHHVVLYGGSRSKIYWHHLFIP